MLRRLPWQARYKQAKRLTETSKQLIAQARELTDRSKNAELPAEEQQRLRADAEKLLDRSMEISRTVINIAR